MKILMHTLIYLDKIAIISLKLFVCVYHPSYDSLIHSINVRYEHIRDVSYTLGNTTGLSFSEAVFALIYIKLAEYFSVQ